MSGLGALLGATGIPFLAAGAGAALASTRPPSKSAQSAVQHLAAGLVFAAASAELVPDLLAEHHEVAVAVGFAVGIGTMLFVKRFGDRMVNRPGFGGGSGYWISTVSLVGGAAA